jgi:hypothetical protein
MSSLSSTPSNNPKLNKNDFKRKPWIKKGTKSTSKGDFFLPLAPIASRLKDASNNISDEVIDECARMLIRHLAVSEYGLMYFYERKQEWRQVKGKSVSFHLGSTEPLKRLKRFYFQCKVPYNVNQNKAKVVVDPLLPNKLFDQGLIFTVNLWKGFDLSEPKLDSTSATLDDWKEFVRAWICFNDEVQFNNMMQIFKEIVQRPHQRLNKVIIIQANVRHVRFMLKPFQTLLFNKYHYGDIQGKTVLNDFTRTTKWALNVLTLVLNPIPDPVKVIKCLTSDQVEYRPPKGDGKRFWVKNMIHPFIVSTSLSIDDQMKGTFPTIDFILIGDASKIVYDQIDHSRISHVSPLEIYQYFSSM